MKQVHHPGIISVFLLLSATMPGTSKTDPATTYEKRVPVECRSTVAFATNFVAATNDPQAVLVRKNVYSLTAAEITSLKTGITAMKALPSSNPTSWAYQAAIHGTTLSGSLPSWNSCQHGTQFFFSWHRMYLYFFERILRAKSGNANLTLPYWNYQTNAVLHPEYRNNTAGNPLFHVRGASINSGGSLASSPMTAIANALNEVAFFDFQSFIEGPHGSIHGAIGGDMSAVNRAAKDPVFWLHHTNIDRLWEEWLRKCGGRSNPPASNTTWMNQTYTFFDENGAAVNMTGSKILNTASQLNYRYDFPFKLPCNFRLDWWKWKLQVYPLIRWPLPLKINQRSILPVREAKTEELDRFVQREKRETIQMANNQVEERLVLELRDIKIDKTPEGVVEIYLNLGPNEVPNPNSAKFVGVLDLFTPGGHMHGNEKVKTQRINVTRAIGAQSIKLNALKQAQLTFVVRGNNVSGREKTTTAQVQVGNLNLQLERLTKQ